MKTDKAIRMVRIVVNPSDKAQDRFIPKELAVEAYKRGILSQDLTNNAFGLISGDVYLPMVQLGKLAIELGIKFYCKRGG